MASKICVVTGSRADYGLLFWLMKGIQEDPDLELQIIVTGMHLSPEFGLTYKVIEQDGFHIDFRVESLLSSDSAVGIAKSIGLGVIGCAEALDRLRPDILVLLGDRFEIMAAAQAAMLAKVPIAHIHGGEATEGLIDEAIRHAVTKMAHLHFTAAEQYRRRVIQMGEAPGRVFNFGAIGLDNIKMLDLLDRDALSRSLGFQIAETNFLVTYHPVSLQMEGPERSMKALFEALDKFPESTVVFTKPNADPSGRVIGSMIDEYVACNGARAAEFTSLGQLKYLSAIKHSAVIVGNSSSGIIEVPAFRKPTVNIGDRQKGRLAGLSIINCKEDADAITTAIKKSLTPEFLLGISTITSLYGEGGASLRIKEKLKEASLEGILMKKFYDIGCKG